MTCAEQTGTRKRLLEYDDVMNAQRGSGVQTPPQRPARRPHGWILNMIYDVRRGRHDQSGNHGRPEDSKLAVIRVFG
jgi:hypothetical protein